MENPTGSDDAGATTSIVNIREGMNLSTDFPDNDEDGQPKMSPRTKIQLQIDQFKQMIDFMDFKFEAQFQ